MDLFAVHIGKGGSGDVFTIDGGVANLPLLQRAGMFGFRGNRFFNCSPEAPCLMVTKVSPSVETVAQVAHCSCLSAVESFKNLLNSFTLGNSDNGQVILTGGIMETEGGILLGGTAGVGGSFIMGGGQLTADDIFVSSGNPSFNFDGGEIFLAGDRRHSS